MVKKFYFASRPLGLSIASHKPIFRADVSPMTHFLVCIKNIEGERLCDGMKVGDKKTEKRPHI